MWLMYDLLSHLLSLEQQMWPVFRPCYVEPTWRRREPFVHADRSLFGGIRLGTARFPSSWSMTTRFCQFFRAFGVGGFPPFGYIQSVITDAHQHRWNGRNPSKICSKPAANGLEADNRSDWHILIEDRDQFRIRIFHRYLI